MHQTTFISLVRDYENREAEALGLTMQWLERFS
jgi:hypothetical protein